jgi:hypothetical protein
MAVTQGDVLWTPPADVRTTTQVGRFMAFVAARGVARRLRRGRALVGRRPRGVLGGDLGLLRRSRAHALRARAERAGHAGRALVSRRDAQRRRAHGRPRRGRRPRRDRRPVGVARARAGLQRLGVGPGDRVVAYLPNIPETLVVFLATASLGAVWRSARPSSAPARSSTASASSRRRSCSRSRATAMAAGTSTAAPRSPRSAPTCPRASTSSTSRTRAGRTTRCPTRPSGTTSSRSPRRCASTRCRSTTALRALLLGYDRAAEADRPRPRRAPRRGLQEPRPELGPPARRPPAVVLDDRMDDVDRARHVAPAPRVDRDDRRQPRLPGPVDAVAPG